MTTAHNKYALITGAAGSRGWVFGGVFDVTPYLQLEAFEALQNVGNFMRVRPTKARVL